MPFLPNRYEKRLLFFLTHGHILQNRCRRLLFIGLMDEIRGQLFDTEAVEPRNDRVEPFRLKFRERRLDRLKYTARTVFSPRRLHLEAAQLPAALSWAYYPLKVGIDYAVAPAWRALNRLKG